MKSTTRYIVAALLAVSAGSLGINAIAAETAHDHAQAAQGTMELNQGQKWETDAPLRQGMGTLHEIVTQGLADTQAEKLSADDYQKMSGKIMTQVTYIVQNCHLEPDADAQLHILLGQIVQGAEIVEGKVAHEKPGGGLVKLAQALNGYGTHFNHPGWAAIDVSH